jgi:hypothetical protein
MPTVQPANEDSHGTKCSGCELRFLNAVNLHWHHSREHSTQLWDRPVQNGAQALLIQPTLANALQVNASTSPPATV